MWQNCFSKLIIYFKVKKMKQKKPKDFVGIDVSKKTIDVSKRKSATVWLHKTFANDITGYRELVKVIGKQAHYVMEATGIYHLCLAYYLTKRGINVSVLNPLIIKRYRQMQLGRIKTDKTDSRCIAEYAQTQPLQIWQAPSELLLKVHQEDTLLELLHSQRIQLINHLESLTHQPFKSKLAQKLIKDRIRGLEEEIVQLENSIIAQMENEYEEEMNLLCTIPGISRRSAVLLLIVTRGLKDFETSKQLCSYVGLTPMVSESGSSIRRRGKISKMGSSRLRKQLYMCSWSAIRFNDQCKSMYERMRLAGKPGKVIMVAIMNKLLRQAFGVVKNKASYSIAA